MSLVIGLRDGECCNLCGVELSADTESLHYDCGGDCLTCMAQAGDPDCVERIIGFTITDCLAQLKVTVRQHGDYVDGISTGASENFYMRIQEGFRAP